LDTKSSTSARLWFGSLANSSMPVTAFSGVRMSWLIFARKLVWASTAAARWSSSRRRRVAYSSDSPRMPASARMKARRRKRHRQTHAAVSICRRQRKRHGDHDIVAVKFGAFAADEPVDPADRYVQRAAAGLHAAFVNRASWSSETPPAEREEKRL
jgi:hypothetical protein